MSDNSIEIFDVLRLIELNASDGSRLMRIALSVVAAALPSVTSLSFTPRKNRLAFPAGAENVSRLNDLFQQRQSTCWA